MTRNWDQISKGFQAGLSDPAFLLPVFRQIKWSSSPDIEQGGRAKWLRWFFWFTFLQNENKWKHHQDVCFLREANRKMLVKKQYHNNFSAVDIYRIIAGISAPPECHISWSYQRFWKPFIHLILADNAEGACPVIRLQYLQNMRTQDTCFYCWYLQLWLICEQLEKSVRTMFNQILNCKETL